MKELAIRAAKEAGKFLLDNFGKHHKIKSKNPHDFVTEVDVKAESIIKNILKPSGYSFLGEEGTRIKTKSEYQWIVDPLDGTTNYIIQSPLFCTSIGLAHRNEIVLSAIYIPVLKELYVAEKNKGAFLNGKRIHVSNIKKLKDSFVIYCHGKKSSQIKRAIEIHNKTKLLAKESRQFGSAGIEFAYVAAGRVEAFFAPGAKAWDASPGSLLVKESGGEVTDFDGKEWNIPSDRRDSDFLATNREVHQEIIKIIKKK